MQKGNKNEDQKNQSKTEEDRKPGSGDEKVTEALKQAETDMEQDPDLSTEYDPAADLDEGELARLEGQH